MNLNCEKNKYIKYFSFKAKRFMTFFVLFTNVEVLQYFIKDEKLE